MDSPNRGKSGNNPKEQIIGEGEISKLSELLLLLGDTFQPRYCKNTDDMSSILQNIAALNSPEFSDNTRETMDRLYQKISKNDSK